MHLQAAKSADEGVLHFPQMPGASATSRTWLWILDTLLMRHRMRRESRLALEQL
jgi:hypothetical protein